MLDAIGPTGTLCFSQLNIHGAHSPTIRCFSPCDPVAKPVHEKSLRMSARTKEGNSRAGIPNQLRGCTSVCQKNSSPSPSVSRRRLVHILGRGALSLALFAWMVRTDSSGAEVASSSMPETAPSDVVYHDKPSIQHQIELRETLSMLEQGKIAEVEPRLSDSISVWKEAGAPHEQVSTVYGELCSHHCPPFTAFLSRLHR